MTYKQSKLLDPFWKVNNRNVFVISISPITKKESISFSQGNMTSSMGTAIPSTDIKQSKDLVKQGNDFLKTKEFDKAIESYNQALVVTPDDLSINYSIGKAYKGKEDYQNAIPNIETYLNSSPEDSDAIADLGECYKKSGMYGKAKQEYSKLLEIDPNNDLASRNLAEIDNNVLSCYDPVSAMKQKRQQSLNNLNQALKMSRDYLPTGFLKDMGDLTICIDKTAKLGGTPNIAQYEHAKRKITITDSYVYASPRIVSAYLIHEFVHAKDKDPYTSVTEEQDAYKKETEFWVKNNAGIKDPELDYAASLYNQSPATLDARVAEIYRLRDPNIATISPNHPPGNKKLATSPINSSTSGQPLQNYDVIS